MRKKNNNPADVGHFLRRAIDLKDFENEKLTAKIRRNKAEKPYFFQKMFQKVLKKRKPWNKIITLKNVGQRNRSNKIAENCWLSRYK